MADDSLKDAYRNIEAEAVEMAVYRTRLAGRLPNRFILSGWWLALAGAAALCVLVLLGRTFLQPAKFPQWELGELQQAVMVGNPEKLLAQAHELATNGKGRDRLNSFLVLCLLQPPKKGVSAAAEGLVNDPRPEFRFFYLEYLLDFADEKIYDVKLLEYLMDREQDLQCRRLLKNLWKVAIRGAGRDDVI